MPNNKKNLLCTIKIQYMSRVTNVINLRKQKFVLLYEDMCYLVSQENISIVKRKQVTNY